MSINSTTNTVQIQGNGVTTAFGFPLPFFLAADLVVTLLNTSTGQPVTPAPVLNGGGVNDYTLALASVQSSNNNAVEYTGTVNFTNAPAANVQVTIQRVLAVTQNLNLIDNSKFPSSAVNAALDRLTMISQQLAAMTGLSLQIPASDPPGLITVAPSAALRAGLFAGFDASGNFTALAAPVGTSAVSAAMAPVIAAATLALARTALGLGSAATQNGALAGLNAGVGVLASGSNLVVDASYLRGFIDGFETGAPGGNNIITFGPGACVDSTNAALIKSTTAAFTKTLASFATGSGNGGLDTGASLGAINTPYFGHVILNPTTGAVDFLLSLSATAPTLPSGFTLFRCLAWGKTDGSKNFLQYQQRGDEFIYGVSVTDVSGGAVPSGARSLVAMTVPSGFVVKVGMRVALVGTTSPTFLTLTCPDETDQGTGLSAAFGDVVCSVTSAAGAARVEVRTNTSAQIGVRGHSTDTYTVNTFGFTWTRGRNS